MAEKEKEQRKQYKPCVFTSLRAGLWVLQDESRAIQDAETYPLVPLLQNPPDCSKARKLVCNINKGCGYGCQLHHVVYCFMIAYGTQRTLILESHNWRYAPAGWETVFLPVSNTCTDRSGATTGHWSGRCTHTYTNILTSWATHSGTTWTDFNNCDWLFIIK